MEISKQTRIQLAKVSSHYSQWVIDTLQFEMGHDETWPAIKQTISEAFSRIPDATDPVATAYYVRDLSLHFGAHKLGNKACWEQVRAFLLRHFSDQRGCIAEIKQLLKKTQGSKA